jgi:heterodisulfide reductase subunit C
MTEQKPAINMDDVDLGFAAEIMSYPGGENLRKCFACGTCTAGCPISEIDEEYNPRRIIREVLFGLRDEVLQSPAIWYCLVCYRCYAHCPQNVNFPDLMRVLRYLAIKENYARPDIAERIQEIDKRLQILRHDLIKYDLTAAHESQSSKG